MWTKSSRTLLRGWMLCPVTGGLITFTVLLYAAVVVYRLCFPEQAHEAPRVLGAVSELAVVGNEELSGPLELWSGQWWRVPLSGFHHANLVHLVLNCLALGFLGWLLEPKMSRWGFFTFFLCATVISLLPEFLLEHYVVGLSGGIYALFGALLVLRKRDEDVAASFSETIVRWGLLGLLAGVALTAFDLVPIANLAHFVGFGYGWLAGQMLFGRWSSRRGARWAFFAAHLAVIGTFHVVMHPFWNGRYHWYRAIHEDKVHQRVVHLQSAVTWNPGLGGAWRSLAEGYAGQGQLQRAWRTVLEGLRHNRSDEKGVALSRRIWNHFPSRDHRRRALQVLQDVFPGEEEAWRRRLQLFSDVPTLSDLRLPQQVRSEEGSEPSPPVRFPSVQLASPADGETVQERDLTAPAVNPDDRSSASEGVGL